MSEFDIIVAMTEKYGIGKNNSIPWVIKKDIEYFKNITTKTFDLTKKNCCIMGKNTYLSIPKKFRPLKDRLNIVLTHNIEQFKKEFNDELVILFSSLENALEYLKPKENIENVFVIGGAQVYKEAIENVNCKKIYLTKILDSKQEYICDIYFPKNFTKNFKKSFFNDQRDTEIYKDCGIDFTYNLYEKI